MENSNIGSDWSATWYQTELANQSYTFEPLSHDSDRKFDVYLESTQTLGSGQASGYCRHL